jgi:hypothetical protein
MMRLLVVAILAALVTPASASLEPPTRYDRPYYGQLIIVQQSLAGIRRSCRDPYCWAWTYGDEGGKCTIYLPKVGSSISRAFFNKLYRHERAHCNGWPANHPR